MRKTAERRSQHRIHRIHRVLVEVAVQALVVSWWKPPHATSHLAPNGVECGDPKPPCGKRCVFSSRSRMKKLEYTRQMYFQGSFSECHPISSRISVATGSGIDLDGQCTVHISGAAGNHKSGVLLCFDEISGLLFQWAPKSDLAFNDFEMASALQWVKEHGNTQVAFSLNPLDDQKFHYAGAPLKGELDRNRLSDFRTIFLFGYVVFQVNTKNPK